MSSFAQEALGRWEFMFWSYKFVIPKASGLLAALSFV